MSDEELYEELAALCLSTLELHCECLLSQLDDLEQQLND